LKEKGTTSDHLACKTVENHSEYTPAQFLFPPPPKKTTNKSLASTTGEREKSEGGGLQREGESDEGKKPRLGGGTEKRH